MTTACSPDVRTAEDMPGSGLPYGIIDPDYARIFTIARIVAWQYGYAIAMQGSFTRDLDLVMLPWTDRACDPLPVVNLIAEASGTNVLGEPGDKPHGRKAWTLMLPGFSERRWVDLSVMPRLLPPVVQDPHG